MSKFRKALLLASLSLATFLSFPAQATLIENGNGSTGRLPFSTEEMGFVGHGLAGFLDGAGTQGPVTFLAALGDGPYSNIPGPVNGALDSDRFTVTPTGNDVTVSWDLTDTGYTIAFVVLETDVVVGAPKFPHPLGGYVFYASNQPLDFQGSQFLNHFDPTTHVSHVDFFGVQGLFHIPDSGETIVLLVLGISGILLARRIVVHAD